MGDAKRVASGISFISLSILFRDKLATVTATGEPQNESVALDDMSESAAHNGVVCATPNSEERWNELNRLGQAIWLERTHDVSHAH